MAPIDLDPDMTRSTGQYPTPLRNNLVIDEDVDFSKSTMAYPMDKEPATVSVVAGPDATKSTGAYPMYDDERQARAAARRRGVTIEQKADNGAAAEPPYPTPGPISSGLTPALIAEQREKLGLSPDPTGMGDNAAAKAAAEAELAAQAAAQEAAAKAAAEAEKKDKSEGKVITPPVKEPAKRSGGAQGK